MPTRPTGKSQSQYIGVEARTPPDFITISRAPTLNDYKDYQCGTFWLHMPAEDLWLLVSKDGCQGNWIKLNVLPATSAIETLTGNVGGAVGPDLSNNVDLLGVGGVLVTGNPGTNTLEISVAGLSPALTFTEDVGTANPTAGGNLNVFGGSHITTTGDLASTITIALDNDIAESYTADVNFAVPVAGNLNVLGGLNINTDGDTSDTLTVNLDDPGRGVVFSDASGVLASSNGTNGQVIIGGGADPVWASLTSAGGTITYTPGAGTLNLEAAGGITTATKITTFTVNGTWTKDANAKSIEVYMWDGGSGGGSGRRGVSTAAGGGAGGSTGSFWKFSMPAYFFPASAPVVVGVAAAGGATQTVDNTDGNPGTAANVSTFLGIDSRFGGAISASQGGVNGQTLSGTTGGFAYENGEPAGGLILPPRGGFGELADGGAVDRPIGSFATRAYNYQTAGAGGGGAGADSVAERTGADGSGITYTSGAMFLAGGAGGVESGTINGVNGTANTAILSGLPSGGLGGGGGGGQSVGAFAGNGGDGGIPGGGGGGGGGSLNGTNSGSGGDGARGEVVIVEYL